MRPPMPPLVAPRRLVPLRARTTGIGLRPTLSDQTAVRLLYMRRLVRGPGARLDDGLGEARDVARLYEAVRLLWQARRRRVPILLILPPVLACAEFRVDSGNQRGFKGTVEMQ